MFILLRRIDSDDSQINNDNNGDTNNENAGNLGLNGESLFNVLMPKFNL